MNLDHIIGLDHIKNHLKTSADQGRIAHAQLFSGANGSGTLPMAIAYARYILCNNAKDKSSCELKFENLSHPDLHFAFPVTTTSSVKKHPVSDLFLNEWRSFVKEKSYGDLFEWYQHIGAENKQGIINVDESAKIVQKLSLKSYEGGYKVMLIWAADKMNISAANKLLKLIEEPPEKTIFILITENEDQILQTISSRCQILQFPPLGAGAIASALQNQHNLDSASAEKIAHRAQGNFNNALHLLKDDGSEKQFEEWFITWVRAAFKAKGNKAVVNDLISWSEDIASNGREIQKQFLNYCIDFFRQALLLNYNSPELVFLEPQTANFQLSKFAPFVHGNNIEAIFEALQDALYHIERNGNGKIILTDLSIKLTRLLHVK